MTRSELHFQLISALFLVSFQNLAQHLPLEFLHLDIRLHQVRNDRPDHDRALIDPILSGAQYVEWPYMMESTNQKWSFSRLSSQGGRMKKFASVPYKDFLWLNRFDFFFQIFDRMFLVHFHVN